MRPPYRVTYSNGDQGIVWDELADVLWSRVSHVEPITPTEARIHEAMALVLSARLGGRR